MPLQSTNERRYLTVDYDRRNFSVSQCSWVDGSTANVVTISSPTSGTQSTNTTTTTPHKTSSKFIINGGAIAGIVVGVVVVLAAMILLCILHRRKQNIVNDMSLESLSDGRTFVAEKVSGELIEPPIYEMEDCESSIRELDNTQTLRPVLCSRDISELETIMVEKDASNVPL